MTMTDTKPRKPSTDDRLNERIDELVANTKLDGWNAFIEELQVPQDFQAALMTMRPELVRLAKPRAMSEQEVAMLYKLIAALIGTNMALQQHAAEVAQLVEHWSANFKSLSRTGDRIHRFANFRRSDSGGDENADDE